MLLSVFKTDRDAGAEPLRERSDLIVENQQPNIKTREEACRWAVMRVRALIADERDWVVNTANAAAAIFESWKEVSWAGFYLMKQGELVLGPFQGKPACRRIQVGKGVCGTSVSERRTQIVPDVHQFPGHIACDGGSNSEIVVPMMRDGEVIGVIDLDSYSFNRFDEREGQALEQIARILAQDCDWNL